MEAVDVMAEQGGALVSEQSEVMKKTISVKEITADLKTGSRTRISCENTVSPRRT